MESTQQSETGETKPEGKMYAKTEALVGIVVVVVGLVVLHLLGWL